MPNEVIAINVPHVEGVDPTVLTQIAQLSVQLFAAIAAKNFPQAIALGITLAGLIASLFVPNPNNPPLPPPVK